ncbi:MAG: hypothetical protein OK454_05865 [Thaumarchaeota archaeon]|nr:hypothetical protein [Nitrososphaerota archaeon]MDA4135460.1 hypothetical protein [Nitrososphaerota archaeon]
MSSQEMRKELLAAALERRTVTYGQLMAHFGLARGDSGRTVVGMLGEIDRHEYESGAPGFAAIVVRKDTGYPGGGFFCWDDLPVALRRPKEKCQDPKLSQAEKDYVREQQEKIWEHYSVQGKL